MLGLVRSEGKLCNSTSIIENCNKWYLMSIFPQIINSESLAGAKKRSHYAQQKDSINNSLAADDGISNPKIPGYGFW